MQTSDFDYELPEELIAQEPLPRGTSRLLVLDRRTGKVEHRRISEIVKWLRSDDLLLVNDTKVIPARLYARRTTGRRFELLLLRPLDHRRWQTLLRPSARVRTGEQLLVSDGGSIQPLEPLGEGQWIISCDPPLDLDRLAHLGEAPLPPYIRRPAGATAADSERYQTVYARAPGAVAAPTAGLHFTAKLLEQIRAEGVEVVTVTLHVGIGTFRPVSVDLVNQHTMHAEQYQVSASAAAAVNQALADRRRVVCVGTTSVRALEGGLAAGNGQLNAGCDETEIFIYPGHSFLGVGALLTNFHLPRSTLLMLVSAFAGHEHVMRAYREAVEQRYRFYSYGDAMLVV
jgi:S-adenosylmethionine:tRNA ribosyltransferase-isomerase